MKISFEIKRQNGMNVYYSSDSEKISIICLDGMYYIRIKDDDTWQYPLWKSRGFRSFDDACFWLNLHDWKNASTDNIEYDDSIFVKIAIVPCKDRQSVAAAINTKNLANNLVRVRSSNVWAYGLNMRNNKDKIGDLVVQFKNTNGGAGDVYIYYDVPMMIYRKWQSAPSKGHYFWLYIRNHYNYSKLTGDKRGKLSNAIN